MDDIRGADLLVRTLEELGVSRIFTLSGNHIMPVFDALVSSGIAVIHVRHEAACVHMADAWGRLTGEVGVALVTGGQGHSNGAAALFTALAGESPMLLLSGHAPTNERGLGAFQEMAQADIARPMTKASWTAQIAAGLGDDMCRAFALAKEGRPGPVHVSLPVDLLEAEVSVAASPLTARAEPTKPDDTLIGRIAARLEKAARPVIVCGPSMGSGDGPARVGRLREASGLPVIVMESPRGLNDPGQGALAQLLAQADLIVLVGKPLDFTLKFGRAPAIAQTCDLIAVDPDDTLLARARQAMGARLVESGIADAGPTLDALATRLSGGEGKSGEGKPAWLERARALLAYRPPEWADATGAEGKVHPIALCRSVDAFLARHGGTLVCDGGEIGQWPQALVRAGRRLINGVSGTIGASIPFAIAASALGGQGPVVAVLGDGTFGFHMAEFDTALRYDLPFIAVVGNDARWNAEYQIQLRQYGADRAHHCELRPARYDLVVEALGGFGALVTQAAELPDALERAHASGLPACINVMIEGVPAPSIRTPGG